MVWSTLCPDVDECAMRKDRCGKDFLCENTPGSFKCTPKQKCLSGFTQDAHGNCVGKILRVCWEGSWRTFHLCPLSLDSVFDCADINECSSLAQPCSSSFACVNTVGSFSCQQKVLVCNRGYHTSPDGASCVGECFVLSSTREWGQRDLVFPGSGNTKH